MYRPVPPLLYSGLYNANKPLQRGTRGRGGLALGQCSAFRHATNQIFRNIAAPYRRKKISLTRMILETERFVDEKRRHGFTYIRKQIIRCKGKIDNARERYIKKKKKKKKKKKIVNIVKGSKSKNSKSLINNIFKSFHKDI